MQTNILQKLAKQWLTGVRMVATPFKKILQPSPWSQLTHSSAAKVAITLHCWSFVLLLGPASIHDSTVWLVMDPSTQSHFPETPREDRGCPPAWAFTISAWFLAWVTPVQRLNGVCWACIKRTRQRWLPHWPLEWASSSLKRKKTLHRLLEP